MVLERTFDGRVITPPPDIAVWNNQISTLKLYLQLIWDTDFNNISNVMVDEHWKVWKVDASRSFHATGDLRREESLTRFPRAVLQALEGLEREELERVMNPWLSRRQIKSLWQRRDGILELADERVAEFGEAVVLF